MYFCSDALIGGLKPRFLTRSPTPLTRVCLFSDFTAPTGWLGQQCWSNLFYFWFVAKYDTNLICRANGHPSQQ